MSKIIAINAGSSSLKFKLLEMPEESVITAGVAERIGLQDSFFSILVNGENVKVSQSIQNHTIAVELLLEKLISYKIIDSINDIQGVGHRVVHGGEAFKDSTLIDLKVLKTIEKLSDLAPLHNPANLVGIEAFMEALPNVGQVAIFDTAFHQTMPKEAYIYPVPYEWYENYGVRKYGFHGTSHKFVSQRAAELLEKKPEEVNVITMHIGNGVSMCAVKNGISVDTTMGMTPLAGIAMGTRSGNIDPAIIEYIADKEERTIHYVIKKLNKESGMLGISGVSSDNRDIRKQIELGNERCKLAFDIQVRSIANFVSAYYTIMGGADALVFTAGIGENDYHFRRAVCERLAILGVEVDVEENACRGVEKLISKPGSRPKVFVIPTNEELMMARDTFKILN